VNVTLYRQDVDLARPVRASAQAHNSRSRLFLCIDADGVTGFGEVAPQPHELNGDPGVDDVIGALRALVTRLEGVVAREGALPSWSRVAQLGAATPVDNVATALAEMAVLDRELRAASSDARALWTSLFDTPQQATCSLLDDDTTWDVPDNVTRVRAKIAPGPLSERAMDRLAQLNVPVLVDYNCSASSDDEVRRHVDQIRDVATISAVEQPYAAGNVADHARLAKRLDVPVSIDEGVRSMRDLTQIVNYGAATMVCVKPARVGGLSKARTMIARADELGLVAYLGGFFESPFARHVHQLFANSCVREPSDLGAVELRHGTVDELERVAFSFGVEPSRATLEHARRLFVTGEGAS